MTLLQGCEAALTRSVLVGAAAVVIALPIRSLLSAAKGRLRAFLWLVLLVPYLTPAIVVGYVYAGLSLAISSHRLLHEGIYSGLLLMRMAPLAAAALFIAPGGCSAESRHCFKLLGASQSAWQRMKSRIIFWLKGPAHVPAAVFALVFLFAFAEFELASMLWADSWTVFIFDAQAGGLPVARSLYLALRPASCQAVVLAVALGLLLHGEALSALGGRRDVPRAVRRAADSLRHGLAAAYLVLAAAVVTIGPALFLLLRQVLRNLPSPAPFYAAAKDIGASLLFALGGAAGGWALAGLAAESAIAAKLRGARGRSWLPMLLCAPGLLGGLVLALLAKFVSQRVPDWPPYDTPLPLLIVLALLLLPFALTLRLVVHASGGAPAHAAAMLGRHDSTAVRRAAGRIVWELRTGRRLQAFFLLFWLAYFELTASAILAPAGMTPVPVKLYNMVHYGRIPQLSALLLIALSVPLACAFAAVGAARLGLALKRS